jgi:two-component system LytT family response regulator
MIKTIIIDDEADGRAALKIAIEKYCPEIEIKALCNSPADGINAIATYHPDLLFLDIQMPQMSGFDLLQHVLPFSFEVIFVSAYEKYAIKAIRFSALDYLLKPIDIDDLVHAVQKAKARMDQKQNSFQYQSVLHNIQMKGGKIDRLAVPSLDGIDFFNTADIVYCQADGSYTKLILTNKEVKTVTRNLKDFENLLTDSDFCRVHNASLINMRHVQKYIKGEGGYVILTNNYHVDVSRRKKEEFIKRLNTL